LAFAVGRRDPEYELVQPAEPAPLRDLLAGVAAGSPRWLVVAQPGVDIGGGVDRFVATAAAAGFDLAMPAHRAASCHRFVHQRRRIGAIARRVSYIDPWPVVAVSPGWQPAVLEVVAAEPATVVALELARLGGDGALLGIVDRTPMHAGSWPPEPDPADEAELEARLDRYGIVSPTPFQQVHALQWTLGVWWAGRRRPPWAHVAGRALA
jgi:hypothetical protein